MLPLLLPRVAIATFDFFFYSSVTRSPEKGLTNFVGAKRQQRGHRFADVTRSGTVLEPMALMAAFSTWVKSVLFFRSHPGA